ncbi:MAG: winged helix-turn-helix domain-containing protein [Endomicrobiia bacterium]|nr:winged helix-turn-helix domain-containing protein [Endomicrobiia bacterium]
MNDKIGDAAGEIWRLLTLCEPASILKIKTSLSLPNSAVHLALGWLARENKIVMEEKGNTIFVSLKK